MHRNQINLRVMEDDEHNLLRLRLEALQSLEDKILKNKETTMRPGNGMSPYAYESNTDRNHENWDERSKMYCFNSQENLSGWQGHISQTKVTSPYRSSVSRSSESIKNVQLSPRSLAFVSENMDILSKRKGGISPYRTSPRYSVSPNYGDRKRTASPLFPNHADKYYKKSSPSHRERGRDFKIRKRSSSRSSYKSPSGRHYSANRSERPDYSPCYSPRIRPDTNNSHNQQNLSQSPKRNEIKRIEKSNYHQTSPLRIATSNCNNRQQNHFKNNYKDKNINRNLQGSQTNCRFRIRSRSRSPGQNLGASVKQDKPLRYERFTQVPSRYNRSENHPNYQRSISNSPVNNPIKKDLNNATNKTIKRDCDMSNLQSKKAKELNGNENELPKQQLNDFKTEVKKVEASLNISVEPEPEEEDENNDDEDDVCIDLFPSDDSESETEGRFKLNTKTENPAKNNSTPAPVLSFTNLGKSLQPVVKNLDEITNIDKKTNTNKPYGNSSSYINRFKSNGNHRDSYNSKRKADYEDKRRNLKSNRDHYKDRNNERKTESIAKRTFQSSESNDKAKEIYMDKKDANRRNRKYRDMSTDRDTTRENLPKKDSYHLGSSSRSSNNKPKASATISRRSNIHMRLGGDTREKSRNSSRDNKLLDKV